MNENKINNTTKQQEYDDNKKKLGRPRKYKKQTKNKFELLLKNNKQRKERSHSLNNNQGRMDVGNGMIYILRSFNYLQSNTKWTCIL